MLHPRTKVDDLMLSMTETIHGISQGNTQAILWGVSVYFLICGLYSFIFQWRISQWEWVWGSLLHTEIERLVPDNDISEQEYKVKPCTPITSRAIRMKENVYLRGFLLSRIMSVNFSLNNSRG